MSELGRIQTIERYKKQGESCKAVLEQDAPTFPVHRCHSDWFQDVFEEMNFDS